MSGYGGYGSKASRQLSLREQREVEERLLQRRREMARGSEAARASSEREYGGESAYLRGPYASPPSSASGGSLLNRSMVSHKRFPTVLDQWGDCWLCQGE